MTSKEIKRNIRKAEYVFGFIQLTQDDGEYIQLVKKNVLLNIRNDETYQAEMRGNDLYIN